MTHKASSSSMGLQRGKSLRIHGVPSSPSLIRFHQCLHRFFTAFISSFIASVHSSARFWKTSQVVAAFPYLERELSRCIIFVERVVTAVVFPSLLNELLFKLTGWQTKYTPGNGSKFQAESRTIQNTIVEEFRKGIVNIIVATSILKEGLDVQSCNLVIRFDPSTTVCSFIQSRGRARMPNSHFILLVNCEDVST